MSIDNTKKVNKDSNPDPITGEKGSHPAGTGAGALLGATAGAVAGTVLGPIGTAVGAIVGATGAVVGGVIGAYAGKDVAESVNPTEIDTYYRNSFSSKPYAKDSSYEAYKPAYDYGYEARTKYADRNFDEVESDLHRDWSAANPSQDWSNAKEAVRDSYNYTDKIYREKLNAKK